jgi:hypothetical protein
MAGRLGKLRAVVWPNVGSAAVMPVRNGAGMAGIVTRPVHELTVDALGSAGLESAYCAGRQRAATVVQLYGERDGRE